MLDVYPMFPQVILDKVNETPLALCSLQQLSSVTVICVFACVFVCGDTHMAKTGHVIIQKWYKRDNEVSVNHLC